MDHWLARVRHDLVKYAVWRARDLRDQGGRPSPVDLLALGRGVLELRDDDGKVVTASALFRRLRDEIEAPAAPLDAFSRVVDGAERAVEALDREPIRWREAISAVMGIETAFEDMARALKK